MWKPRPEFRPRSPAATIRVSVSVNATNRPSGVIAAPLLRVCLLFGAGRADPLRGARLPVADEHVAGDLRHGDELSAKEVKATKQPSELIAGCELSLLAVPARIAWAV